MKIEMLKEGLTKNLINVSSLKRINLLDIPEVVQFLKLGGTTKTLFITLKTIGFLECKFCGDIFNEYIFFVHHSCCGKCYKAYIKI